MLSAFKFKIKNLEKLKLKQASKIMRRLLWAETAKLCIGQEINRNPLNINKSFGGLNAIIKNSSSYEESFIPKGLSGYIFSISNLTPKECQKRLHVTSNLSKPLKPSIKKLLKNKGTLVLFLLSNLPTKESYKERIKAIQEDLKKYGFTDSSIKIYALKEIAVFINEFPSIWGHLNKKCGYFNYYNIPDKNLKVPENFIKDDKREIILQNIRNEINQSPLSK